jgi:cytochrome c1
MRFVGRRLFGLGLILGGIAWMAGRSRSRSPRGVSRDARPEQTGGEAALASRSDEPRGHETVLVVFCLALLAALAGFGWQEMQQRSALRATAVALTSGNPDHAPAFMARYGCGGCHSIPGIPGADGKVGPSLAGLRERIYVGGVLGNTAVNLVGWIVDPQRFSPRSAMPATGITEAEARDVAAYLYMQ